MDALLYGHNPRERIVAVHHLSDNLMRMYVRGDGGVSHEDVEFFPFFFLSDQSLLSEYPGKHWIKELEGGNFFRFLCAFPRWSEMWEALRHILERYNTSASQKAGSYLDLPIVSIRPDPVTQSLMESGRTLFKGMEFREIHRMQLDIETYARSLTRGSARHEEPIIIIAISDNRGWEHIIEGRKKSEKDMLVELAETIQERDPDVIEGHNIFGFDIPYIVRRAQRLGVELKIGRDGSPLRSFDRRRNFSDVVPRQPYDIPGRHIIDTLQLLKAYDAAKRNLESYGLKYAAQYFGFARQDRVYIKGDQIWWHWDNNPEKLLEYARDDIRETAQLSEILSPSIFYITQMVPLDYETVARSGSAAKIESLLVREYVRQKHSIPKPQIGSQQTGGYTDLFYTGVVGPIVYADVQSLYPSIMIGENIAPETDELKVFPRLLEQLTAMRLDAKKRMAKASDNQQKVTLDAMQSSYKILINSFYGYLGYSRGLFNDFRQADAVTSKGQKILRALIDDVRRRNGKVIEVDTDGIFFVPPVDVQTAEDEQRLVKDVAGVLPAPIKLHIDGRHRKMLSYKKKNYALLDYDGNIIVKGSSLVSRSIEEFGRNYVEQCIRHILEGNVAELHKLYADTHNRMVHRGFTIKELARTETLWETQEQYERDVATGKRNRSASYEAATAARMQWKSGRKVSYYVTGGQADVVEFSNCKLVEQWDPNFPDENIPHYLRRLDEFSKKFESFFLPQDFRAVFSLDDLFDFSARGVGTVIAPVGLDAVSREVEVKESFDFPIWLDTGEGGRST